jgi:hypothetical protein
MRFQMNRRMLRAAIAASVVVTSTAVCEASLPGNRSNLYRPMSRVGFFEQDDSLASWHCPTPDVFRAETGDIDESGSDLLLEECTFAAIEDSIRKNVDWLMQAAQTRLADRIQQSKSSVRDWIRSAASTYAQFIASNRWTDDRAQPNAPANLFVFALDESQFLEDHAGCELETIESQCWHEQIATGSAVDLYGASPICDLGNRPSHDDVGFAAEVAMNPIQRGVDPICPEIQSIDSFPAFPFVGCGGMPDSCYDETAIAEAEDIPIVGPQLADAQGVDPHVVETPIVDEKPLPVVVATLASKVITEDDFLPSSAMPIEDFHQLQAANEPVFVESEPIVTEGAEVAASEVPQISRPFADLSFSRRLIESWLEPNWDIRKWELTTANRSLRTISQSDAVGPSISETSTKEDSVGDTVYGETAYYEAVPKRPFPLKQLLGPEARMYSEIPIDPMLAIAQDDPWYESFDDIDMIPAPRAIEKPAPSSPWLQETLAFAGLKFMNIASNVWDSAKQSSHIPKKAIARQIKQIGLFFLRSADRLEGSHGFADRGGQDSIR